MCLKSPDDISGGGDGYDTDMDDKMGLARSPSRHPLQDTGLDIQATQAGVSWLPCPLHALPFGCWVLGCPAVYICHPSTLICSTCCPCTAAS